jgi:diadenosine tetraphosphate (Ap4A) HIT family hydrolase
MAACVFCGRIERGEFDYSGYGAVSFVPLKPRTPGHRLFLPVRHVVDGRDFSGLHSATALASSWAKDWENNPDYRGDFNLITSAGAAATQTVMHLHVHYVPRRVGDGLALPWTEPHHG